MNRSQRRAAWQARHRQENRNPPVGLGTGERRALAEPLLGQGAVNGHRESTPLLHAAHAFVMGVARSQFLDQIRESKGPTTAREHAHVHIEELVLHGVPRSQRHEVGEALLKELSMLLTETGVPPALRQSSDMLRADLPSLASVSELHAATLGAQVALAVYGGPGRE
jgi:hypothetical protein